MLRMGQYPHLEFPWLATAAVAVGEACVNDPDGSVLTTVSNPPFKDSVDIHDQVQMYLPALTKSASGLGDNYIGAAMNSPAAGETCIVCVFGVCWSKCLATTTDGDGTAYAVSATAGQIDEVTPSTSVLVNARQLGASGATTAGDPRLTFVNGLFTAYPVSTGDANWFAAT